MCKDVLITGVRVKDQMKAAKEILINDVIPKQKDFLRKEKEGRLSKGLKKALKTNA